MNDQTNMGMVEYLWELYTNSEDYQERPEPVSADEIREQLYTLIGENTTENDMMPCVFEFSSAMEKVGFITGFKTAMRLAAETFLNGGNAGGEAKEES